MDLVILLINSNNNYKNLLVCQPIPLQKIVNFDTK